MNFLEAKRLVDGFTGGAPLNFLLALSGSSEPFDLYLRAAAAKRGLAANVRVLPFNTLAQTLRAEPKADETEVFFLLPWDFVAESDWRSGIPVAANDAALREQAMQLARLLERRSARIVYLPAPMPALFSDPSRDEALATWIRSIAVGLGATVLSPDAFSLSTYLTNGCPVGGRAIGAAAEVIVERAAERTAEPKKVLITDFDNVLWHGGIAEDGPDGISYEPQGRGFLHFVYQSFLRRIRHEGVLIAGVSRNDADTAIGPLRSGKMVLGENDFVGVIASYNAKSAQISELASRLNLGLDSFVFVDDNPVELTEVSLALPTVRCVPFPDHADKLPAFFHDLSQLFARRETTTEDRERTEMYRRRLEGMAPSTVSGADLTDFLAGLEMRLTLHDRSTGDRTRAVQLINKTNQFNLNGRRVAENDVAAILDAGGRLYGATLADRTGSHGEILSCLVDQDGIVRSFVMSCRVFQRRVEHAFLAWLTEQDRAPTGFDWASTSRNEPFAQFLVEMLGSEATPDGLIPVEAKDLRARFGPSLDLFKLEG